MRSQLMFNEPPKLFQFNKFDVSEITGEFEYDLNENPVLLYTENEYGDLVYKDN